MQAEKGQTTAKSEAADLADLIARRGAALSGLLGAGTRFLKLAAGNLPIARDALAKLAPVLHAGTWAVCEDLESMRRIAPCPAAVAATLKDLAAKISEQTSLALSEVTDMRIGSAAIEIMRDKTDPETFVAWLSEDTYDDAWKQLVIRLNRVPSVMTEG